MKRSQNTRAKKTLPPYTEIRKKKAKKRKPKYGNIVQKLDNEIAIYERNIIQNKIAMSKN